jgi:hypothetical protein
MMYPLTSRRIAVETAVPIMTLATESQKPPTGEGEKRNYAPIHARVLGGMVETGVVIKLKIRNSAC